jgi:tRNA A-37 threonylcarbamoyl transferase component Bud32
MAALEAIEVEAENRYAKRSQTCFPVQPLSVNLGNKTGLTWVVDKIIGEGAYGLVSEVCDAGGDCNFALKYMPVETDQTLDEIRREIEFSIVMGNLNFGPKVYDAWLCEAGGAFVMEKFDITLHSYLLSVPVETRVEVAKQVLGLIWRFHNAGFEHGDLHLKNIVVKVRDGITEARLIDFMFAKRVTERISKEGKAMQLLTKIVESHS